MKKLIYGVMTLSLCIVYTLSGCSPVDTEHSQQPQSTGVIVTQEAPVTTDAVLPTATIDSEATSLTDAPTQTSLPPETKETSEAIETVKPTAAATETGTLKSYYDPTDYGADPTGKKDSSAAFEAMVKDFDYKRYIEVRIPAGVFLFKKQCVIKPPAGVDVNYYGLTVSGAGEETTQLCSDNNKGVFDFAAFGISIYQVGVQFKDLSFVALRDDSGTALQFDITNPGDFHGRQFTASNITVRGKTFNNGSFKKGIVVSNAWYPLLSNVKVTAKYGPNAETPSLMTHAITLNKCYSPIIRECYVWNGRNGITVNSSDTSGNAGATEDGIITNTYCVGNDIGINLNISSEQCEPNFKVNNCHIAYNDTGLKVNGIRQMNIESNVFYCNDRDGSEWLNSEKAPRSFSPKDIELVFAQDVIITDNQFLEPSNPKRAGIYISAKSTHIWISNNIFGMEGICILNDSKGPVGKLSDNIFQDSWGFGRNAVQLKDNTGKFTR